MVAKFFMCERKVGNLMYFFLVILFLIFINKHGKQHKMPKATRCNRMIANI